MTQKDRLTLAVYTDGSSGSTKNTCGGWACVAVFTDAHVQDTKLFELTGYELATSNQRMEIYGALRALEGSRHYWSKLKLEGISIIGKVIVMSDSAYVVNCINDKWYKRWRANGWVNSSGDSVSNRDLWEKLLSQYENMPSDVAIEFRHVKGHDGDFWNEYADKAAKSMKNFAKAICEA